MKFFTFLPFSPAKYFFKIPQIESSKNYSITKPGSYLYEPTAWQVHPEFGSGLSIS
jgi:hypothetical protein